MQRVFIGIPIDKYSQQRINELLRPIENSRQDIRWVPENNRHLTLAFLGNRPVTEVDNLIRLFDETYQQIVHFQYSLSRLTRFPDPMGRIIALTGGPDRSMDRLFQITGRFLQGNKIKFDRKEFRPHITLGRFRKPKHVKTAFDRQMDLSLIVDKIILYKSTLTEFGSIYTSLEETHLGNSMHG